MSDTEEVIAAVDGHPVARAALRDADGTTRMWRSGTALVWTRRRMSNGTINLCGWGADPERVAAALAAALPLVPEVAQLELPTEVIGFLPKHLRVEERWDWEFRWTTTQPPRVPGECDASELTEADHADIDGLLERAYPTASARPGGRRVRGWAGIRVGGALVAVAADTSAGTVGHLSSVTTDPDLRGRGLGAAVTAYLTRLLLDRYGLATLGMYLGNTAATRMYERLGYTDVAMRSAVRVSRIPRPRRSPGRG